MNESLIEKLAEEISEYVTGPYRQNDVAALLVKFALEIKRMSIEP